MTRRALEIAACVRDGTRHVADGGVAVAGLVDRYQPERILLTRWIIGGIAKEIRFYD